MKAEDVTSLLLILSAGTCSKKSQLICDSQLCDKTSQDYQCHPSSLLCSSRQTFSEDIGKMYFLSVPPFTLNQTRQGADHAILHPVFTVRSLGYPRPQAGFITKEDTALQPKYRKYPRRGCVLALLKLLIRQFMMFLAKRPISVFLSKSCQSEF